MILLLRPETIRAFRDRLGLSQRALAELLGVHTMTVYRRETQAPAGVTLSAEHRLALRELERKQTGTIDEEWWAEQTST